MKKSLKLLAAALFSSVPMIAAQAAQVATIPTIPDATPAPAVAAPSVTAPVTAAPGATPSVQNELTPAQREAIRQNMMEQWNKLTPEQKQEIHRQMEEKWKSLTPEQQAAVKENMRQHFNSLTPQEREDFVQRRKGIKPVPSPTAPGQPAPAAPDAITVPDQPQ